MKHLIRLTAVAALVAASALALPTATQADTIYPQSNACNVVQSRVTPGATITFNCSNGTFSPGEFVTVTVEGNTSAQVGFIKSAVTSSGTTTSSEAGAVSVPITFPSDASGNYNVAAVSPNVGRWRSHRVPRLHGRRHERPLPATGIDSGSLLGLWVGGGALVLAGGAVALAARYVATARSTRASSPSAPVPAENPRPVSAGGSSRHASAFCFVRRHRLGRPVTQPSSHSTGPTPMKRHHSHPATTMPGTMTSQRTNRFR